jgi:hypothetical protein
VRLLTTVAPDALRPMLPGAISVETVPGGQTRLTATLSEGKSAVYRRAIQDGMCQLARGANGDAQALRVTGAHGLASLRMALDAERMGASRPHNTG